MLFTSMTYQSSFAYILEVKLLKEAFNKECCEDIIFNLNLQLIWSSE